jgi:hypothetical protein
VAAALQASGDKVFPGEAAHMLYTTMGFPVDLTTLMAEEKVRCAGGEDDHGLTTVAHSSLLRRRRRRRRRRMSVCLPTCPSSKPSRSASSFTCVCVCVCCRA